MSEPTDPSDAQLLDAWGSGDEEAGNRLVRRHFKAVYRFFRTKVPDVADDLTQGTFLACVEGRARFRREASFRVYVLAIARKQLFRYFRRRRSDQQRIEFGHRSVADLAPTPSKAVAQTEREAILVEALRLIPLDDQIALELRYWEGMTQAQIAQFFDVAEGTAKSRLYEARQRLRDALLRLAVPRAAGPRTTPEPG